MIIPNVTTSLMLQTMLYLANNKNGTMNSMNGENGNNDIEMVCYGVYGCFPNNGPFTTNTRQINVLPQKPSEIEPRFLVFTGRNSDVPKLVDLNEPESVHNLGVNPYGSIYFVTHGYLEAGDRPWLHEITKALLDAEPEGTASVVVIDWGGGSSPPYVQAVANIRLVGAIAAHVIHLFYEELRLPNLDKVHIIGHSLGAHLAGYAGYTLRRDFGLTIGHITGLDPAEPLFSETDPIVRLDRTDAKYVDIVHTDANPLMSGGLGMVRPIGHVDFYPNGGYDQPGCSLNFEEYMNRGGEKSFFWSVQQFLGCNHIRSYQYYIESIKSKCPFIAVTCDSYESFKDGNCFKCDGDHNCLKFGFHSRSSYNRLLENGLIRSYSPTVGYLLTGEDQPYCRMHYKITVKISSSADGALHGGEIGRISFKLHARNKKESEEIWFTKESMLYEPGSIYNGVVAGDDLGNAVEFLSASWHYETNILNPLTWRILASPRIYIDYLIIESLEYKTKIKLCSLRYSPVINGTPNIFKQSYCRDSSTVLQ